jgi:hypothetical protein
VTQFIQSLPERANAGAVDLYFLTLAFISELS